MSDALKNILCSQVQYRYFMVILIITYRVLLYFLFESEHEVTASHLSGFMSIVFQVLVETSFERSRSQCRIAHDNKVL